MTDIELLKAAAKAAGYTLDADCDRLDERDIGGGPKPWRPLDDDGDAFRLAVDLHIRFARDSLQVAAFCPDGTIYSESLWNSTDERASARRVIVRAAASPWYAARIEL